MWHLSRDPQWPHSISYGLSAYYNIEFVMILNFFDCILKVSASNVSKIPILIFKPVNHNLTITSFYRRIYKQNTTWINLNFLFSAFRDGLYPKGKFQIQVNIYTSKQMHIWTTFDRWPYISIKSTWLHFDQYLSILPNGLEDLCC